MAADELEFGDVKKAIATGRIRRKFTRDPRGVRYEIVGRAVDGRERLVSFAESKAQANYFL